MLPYPIKTMPAIIAATPIVPVAVATPSRPPTMAGPPPGMPQSKFVFVNDETIPDGTIMKPGAKFIKKWSIQNIGRNTSSAGIKLLHLKGTNMADDDGGIVPPTPAGQNVIVSIAMTAPLAPGRHAANYTLVDVSGKKLEKIWLGIDIEVRNE